LNIHPRSNNMVEQKNYGPTQEETQEEARERLVENIMENLPEEDLESEDDDIG